MDELPLLHQAVRKFNCDEISKIEFENLVANSKLINEVDDEGNTALHSAFSVYPHRGIRTLLQAGADPTLRNHQNLTPIEYYFKNPTQDITYSFTPLLLFDIFQQDHPDSMSILSFLRSMPFYGNYGVRGGFNKWLTDIVEVSLLPLDTLKQVLQWTEHKLNEMHRDPTQKNKYHDQIWGFGILKEKLVKEIRLVEKAFGLTEIIDKMISTDATRKAVIRAMLLGDPPLDSLLNDLAEEGLINVLPEPIKNGFDALCREYEDKRLILEDISARPDPLTKEEKAFVIPLCEKLQAIAYNFQAPKNNKQWQERVKSYEVRDLAANRDLEQRYTEYKAKDLEKRQFVFDELNKYKKYISDGTYLGTNGFLAKQQIRDKHADASENRLSYIYKK